MPTSTHRKHHATKAYPLKGYAFVVSTLTICLLASCISRSPYGRTLTKSEWLIDQQIDSAIAHYAQIPEAVLSYSNLLVTHKPHCISTAYFYKAVKALQDRQDKEAQRLLQISYTKDIKAYYHQPTGLRTQLTDTLQTRRDILKADSARQTLGQIRTLSEIEGRLGGSQGAIIAHKADSLRKAIISSLLRTEKPFRLYHATGSDTTSPQPSLPHLPWLIAILTVGIAALCIYDRRRQLYNAKKNEVERQTATIELLNESIRNSEQEKELLRKQAVRTLQGKYDELGRGKHIYKSVMAGGQMKNISMEDEQNFVDYYAFSHPDDYNQLISSYSSLSLRHTTFVILRQLEFSDTEIQRILFVQPSTIRNYRLRIKRNRKK